MARGQLRIYLGAAPGVGKTFAMLNEGRRRHERGTDIVVGFVETHGRPKTAEQIADLEIIPRQKLEYRGTTFEEMDVDAILAVQPMSALIDELAHTNVPGSRNEKRWQDVDELLDAGIDVISTLNIQHLESINDVVERITGSRAARDDPRRRRPASRPDRARRHVTRGAAASDGARQHLQAREDRRRARQLLPARQPRCAARARVAVGRRPRRRSARRVPRTARDHRAVGDARAGARRDHRRARNRDADPPRPPAWRNARTASCSAST